MGASRVEKSTVDLNKFGGASKNETAVASSQPVASTVIIEETIAVLPRQAHEEPAMEYRETVSAQLQSVLSPIKVAQPIVAAASFPQAPKGVPTFGGGSTVVANRPKIEIIGEACESCSA